MSAFFSAGTWVFDKGTSELSQAPPLRWVQRVEIEGARVRIEEEITTANGMTMVSVDAKADGDFYPVSGSPVADEISYSLNEKFITGVGRKNGVVTLRETIQIVEPTTMAMTMIVVVGNREINLGTARFRREIDTPVMPGCTSSNTGF